MRQGCNKRRTGLVFQLAVKGKTAKEISPIVGVSEAGVKAAMPKPSAIKEEKARIAAEKSDLAADARKVADEATAKAEKLEAEAEKLAPAVKAEK